MVSGDHMSAVPDVRPVLADAVHRIAMAAEPVLNEIGRAYVQAHVELAEEFGRLLRQGRR